VEGVGRVTAVGGGVGERADDVEEFDDRAGPGDQVSACYPLATTGTWAWERSAREGC
jgi:hypothetical protein